MAKKAEILQRLVRLDSPHLSLSDSNRGGGGMLPPSGSATFLAPYGAFFNPATWHSLPPFPVMPPQSFAWPQPLVPPGWSTNMNPSGRKANTTISAGEDNVTRDHDVYGNETDQSDESDVVHILSEEEANQFREPPVFDHTPQDESSWQPQRQC